MKCVQQLPARCSSCGTVKKPAWSQQSSMSTQFFLSIGVFCFSNFFYIVYLFMYLYIYLFICYLFFWKSNRVRIRAFFTKITIANYIRLFHSIPKPFYIHACYSKFIQIFKSSKESIFWHHIWPFSVRWFDVTSTTLIALVYVREYFTCIGMPSLPVKDRAYSLCAGSILYRPYLLWNGTCVIWSHPKDCPV